MGRMATVTMHLNWSSHSTMLLVDLNLGCSKRCTSFQYNYMPGFYLEIVRKGVCKCISKQRGVSCTRPPRGIMLSQEISVFMLSEIICSTWCILRLIKQYLLTLLCTRQEIGFQANVRICLADYVTR